MVSVTDSMHAGYQGNFEPGNEASMIVSGKVTIYILEGPGELDSLNNGGS